MEIVIGAALAVTGGALAGFAVRRLRHARKLLNEARAALELAGDVVGTGVRVVKAGTIPLDSDAGRQILDLFKSSCECPNCEEERRIAHVDQKRDEE